MKLTANQSGGVMQIRAFNSMKQFLKLGALYMRAKALDEKIAALREQRVALRKLTAADYNSSSFGQDATRADLVFDIPLAAYFAAYPDNEKVTPKKLDFKSSEPIDPDNWANGEIQGVKHYMEFPAVWAGTLPNTTPPVHVWVKASTKAVFVPDVQPAIATSEPLEPNAKS